MSGGMPVLRPNKGNKNSWELVEEFAFMANLESFSIPAGFQFDGASVPKGAWYTTYSPSHSCVMRAALVHDFLCTRRPKQISSDVAANLFGRMLRDDGASNIKAALMVRAVKWFGPRWP